MARKPLSDTVIDRNVLVTFSSEKLYQREGGTRQGDLVRLETSEYTGMVYIEDWDNEIFYAHPIDVMALHDAEEVEVKE